MSVRVRRIRDYVTSGECETLFGSLRRAFVPTVNQRVFGALNEVFFDSCTCEPGHHCESCGSSRQWLEMIDEINQALDREGVSRIVRDAILLTERIDRIGHELDRMSLEPEICETEGQPIGGLLTLTSKRPTCNAKLKGTDDCGKCRPDVETSSPTSKCPTCNASLEGTGGCGKCEKGAQTNSPTSKCPTCNAPLEGSGGCGKCRKGVGTSSPTSKCPTSKDPLEGSGSCGKCEKGTRTSSPTSKCPTCNAKLKGTDGCRKCRPDVETSSPTSKCPTCNAPLEDTGGCGKCEKGAQTCSSTSNCQTCNTPLEGSGGCGKCRKGVGTSSPTSKCPTSKAPLEGSGGCSKCGKGVRTCSSISTCPNCNALLEDSGGCGKCGTGVSPTTKCKTCNAPLESTGGCGKCETSVRTCSSTSKCQTCNTPLEGTGGCGRCGTCRPTAKCQTCKAKLKDSGGCDTCAKDVGTCTFTPKCQTCNTSLKGTGGCGRCGKDVETCTPTPTCQNCNASLKGTSGCGRCGKDVGTCTSTTKCQACNAPLQGTGGCGRCKTNVGTCSHMAQVPTCPHNVPLQSIDACGACRAAVQTCNDTAKCSTCKDALTGTDGCSCSKNDYSCTKTVIERALEDPIYQSPCDPPKNYVRFNLEAASGKECKFATAVPMQHASCQKQPCATKKSATTQHYSCEKLVKVRCAQVGPNENNSCLVLEDHADCSTRCLWDNQDNNSFNTVSSLSDNSVFSSEQLSFSNIYNLAAKISCKPKLDCEYPCPTMSRLIDYKKCFSELDRSICKSRSKCNAMKTVNVQVASPGRNSKCQQVPAAIERTNARGLMRKVSSSDKQTCTEIVDDAIELTNIYINEISFCYCDGEGEAAREVGVNTECMKRSTSVDISTNTEQVNFVESYTQAYHRLPENCRCGRRESTECEIRSFKFDDFDFDVSCKRDKITTTEPRCFLTNTCSYIPRNYPCQMAAALDLMQSWSSSFSDRPQYTNVIRSKIGEIVDLNRRIREKMCTMRETQRRKKLCSVSVQTLNKRGPCRGARKLVQVKLKTSLLSIKPNENIPKKLTCCKAVATEISDRRIPKCRRACVECRDSLDKCREITCNIVPKCRRVCDEHRSSLDKCCAITCRRTPKCRSVCDKYRSSLVKCCARKRSSSTCESDQSVRNLRRPPPVIQQSESLDLTISSSICSIGRNLDRGDFEKMYLLHRPRRRAERRPSRSSKKSTFLNYLSEHLTRESFDRCKRLVRAFLAKFLEGAKRLGDYRRRDSRCRCCRCPEKLQDICVDSSSSRLVAGSDTRECPTQPSRARNARRPEVRGDEASRGRSAQDSRDRPEGRRRRRGKLGPVAPPWRKPFDIYEASSDSMPLFNTRK